MEYFIIGFLLFMVLDLVPRYRDTEPIQWRSDGVLAVIVLWPIVMLFLIYFYFEDED